MVHQRTDDGIRLKRERARQAIALAMESRWEEALSANRSILEEFPDDVEAWNRLGKALGELGRYSEARQAFQKTLEVSPGNSIARKNLGRMGLVREDNPRRPKHRGVPPHFFIEETGKTQVTSLVDTAPRDVLAKRAAGEPVYLKPQEHKLLVQDSLGGYLGTVDPKLGLRLLRLIRGGNQYAAAVISLSDQDVRIIIKETHQHPSQIGRLSFPPKGLDGFRPYVWEGRLRSGVEEEEASEGDWLEERDRGLDEVVEYPRGSGRGRRGAEAEEEL